MEEEDGWPVSSCCKGYVWQWQISGKYPSNSWEVKGKHLDLWPPRHLWSYQRAWWVGSSRYTQKSTERMASLCLIFTSMEELPSGIVCTWLPSTLRSCTAEICLDSSCMIRKEPVCHKVQANLRWEGEFLPLKLLFSHFPLPETLSLLLVLGKPRERKKHETLSRAGLDC